MKSGKRKYLDCVKNDQRLSRRVISIKDIVRLVLRSAVEPEHHYIQP